MMKELCHSLYRDREDYYLRWYHSRPLVITSARRDELRRLHAILYKTVDFMAHNYEDYLDNCITLSPEEREILDYQSLRPFKAGTFRPDYLISETGDLKVCEITSRFFAHGIFMTYFAEHKADLYLNGAERESRFEEMMRDMLDMTGEDKEIYVLKSADKTSAIDMYSPFYRYFGKSVTVIEAGEVEARRKEWEGHLLFCALNQKDLMSFGMDILKSMVDSGMINDLRTVLLIHDKRFLNLWFQDSFTSRCLSEEETEFLRHHSIPTFLPGDKLFETAFDHKDDFILKPFRLGKSENVFAGCLTSETEWKGLWRGGAVDGMILQPFLKQRVFPAVWEGKEYSDYICGMMLCIDDRYYDSGVVRASSAPVSNKVDDRKMFVIRTDEESIINEGFRL